MEKTDSSTTTTHSANGLGSNGRGPNGQVLHNQTHDGQAQDGQARDGQTPSGQSLPGQTHDGGFGANQWLVEDMYENYLADPASVDPAWHDFFHDYGKPGTVTRASNADADAAAEDGPNGTTVHAASPVVSSPAASAPAQPSNDTTPAQATPAQATTPKRQRPQ